ncbi:SDR family NAD(P)-dependent oxidoreductase [Wenxinia marina]|uniref:Short-chain dehydrogenase n=1 Tax=Wenxinia marina DSM 24838 TaxID=1123501 RepID=A0A0D0QGG6_9RHOB|nr:SDR family NAD(P)-dependent oxidoreductase [Wenxinia marina]KIQ71367.1 Short-chain dehydrogenase [Wenxinia marina DSM 24838]GGL81287.1 short-chain dehydrogenase [Wenxinia marina]
MREWQGRTYWIVGASEGLGAALSKQLSRVGAKLILSARTEERLTALSAELPGQSRVLPLDVTDTDAVRRAVDEAGDIDGLVYLAGAYWPMSAREWDTDKALTMLDVNLGGAMRVLGTAVPKMLERGRGHIVITGSLVGIMGLPGAVGYGASKAGLINLAETMAADLADTPVEVQLVNPGFVRTRLTDKNDFRMPQIMEPEDAAREIFEHMNGDGFVRNFPLGLTWMLRAGKALPRGLSRRMMKG